MPITLEYVSPLFIISLVAARLNTEIGRIKNVGKNLNALDAKASTVKRKLEELGNDPQADHLIWRQWTQDLTNIFYEVEDIFDCIAHDMMKREQQQCHGHAHLQDQECRSIILSAVSRLFNSLRQRNMAHPEPPTDNQLRNIVWSSFKKWGFPRKISSLTKKLQEIESQIDRLPLTANWVPNGASTSRNGATWNPHCGGTSSIPSSSQTEQLASMRKMDKRTIIENYLTNPSVTSRGVSIIGMSGLGKTTLARSIQSDDKVREHFDQVRWVSARDIGSPMRDQSEVNRHHYPVDSTLRQPPICQRGEKTLLILDDLWEVYHEAWSSFLSYHASEATILITTRDPNVASVTGTSPYYLEKLSPDDCKELIMIISSLPSRYNHSISSVAEKCAGLPLVATLLGQEIGSKCTTQRPEEVISHYNQSDLWDLKLFRDQIFPRLRFNDPTLPPELSKFLAYLTLFPVDYNFKKDELSRIWMAEGFVQPEVWTSSGLQKVGQHTDDLLSRSMLQVSNNPKHNMMETYQMHEFQHRFAQSIASNTCYQVKDGESTRLPFRDTRHLSFSCQTIEPYYLEDIAKKYKFLRTLVFLREKGTDIYELPQSLFPALHFLRVVDLSQSNIEELPMSICKLKHLRYFDASCTHIKRLPYSICELFGLRILKLNCLNLLYLPEKIGNLVNLIQLDVDMTRLCSFPPNIGMLTNLQTLDAFVVKKTIGNHITELKNMNALRGSIRIMELENIENTVQAENAMLKLKTGLQRLELQWTETSILDSYTSADILDVLQPNDNLTELRMTNYSGDKFPVWFGSPTSQLNTIHLYNCPFSAQLPPLWKLPCLCSLLIDTLCELKQVDRQFLGDSQSPRFTALEFLEFRNMEKLVSWEELVPGDLPCLHVLKIVGCPNLSALPNVDHLTKLENLEILRCGSHPDQILPFDRSTKKPPTKMRCRVALNARSIVFIVVLLSFYSFTVSMLLKRPFS